MLKSLSMFLALAILTYAGMGNAQMVGEIGDGQIQNQGSSAARIIKPAPAPKSAAAPPLGLAASPIHAVIESTATLPCNSTLPPFPTAYTPLASGAAKQISASLPGPRVPLYSANMSMPAFAMGTGAVVGNASAPTVPAVPTVVGGPKEAGTSAPVKVASGAEKGRASVVGMGVVVWGLSVVMMV